MHANGRGSRGRFASLTIPDGCRKTRRLQVTVVAVSAGRPADGDHAGVFLLAGDAGAVPVAARRGRVRHVDAVRLVRKLQDAFRRRRLPRLDARDADLLGAGRRDRPVGVAAPRRNGRSRAARRHRLQDAADLAVRGGARGGGDPVAVPVQSHARHRVARARQHGTPVEPPARSRPGAAPDRDRGRVEADQL